MKHLFIAVMAMIVSVTAFGQEVRNPDFRKGVSAEAEYPEIYKGMKVVESTYSTTEYLLMNWGWSGGPENYAEYYPYIKDSWVAQGDDYLYKRTIFYNFTAI